MKIDRRHFLATTASLATLASGSLLLAGDGHAQDLSGLMEAGPLEDMVSGDENAPVTIVEYASMTCPHCANFHTEIYPELKTKYIDTGKVKLIFREFPLDARAYAASMLARCADKQFYFPMIESVWPAWVPFVGGQSFLFFRPVFNVADASISVGVIMLLLFYRSYFTQETKPERTDERPGEATPDTLDVKVE